MMRFQLLYFVLLGWLCKGITAYGGELQNGDFEDGLKGWTAVTGKVTLSEEAHSGSKACRIEATESEEGQANSHYFRVRPYGLYRLVSFVKQLKGEGLYKVTIAWRDSKGSVIRYDNIWQGRNHSSEYEQHGGEYVAPPGAYDCFINIGVQPNNACLFDNIKLQFLSLQKPPAFRFKITWLDLNGKILRQESTRDEDLNPASDPGPRYKDEKDNKIYNGDFEKGMKGWHEYENSARIIPEGFKGTNTCCIKNTGEVARIVSNVFPIEPSRIYTFSAHAGKAKEKNYELYEWNFFSPVGALQAQTAIEVYEHDAECLFDNIQLRLLSSGYPPLKPKACQVWMCPDFRPDPNPLFEPDAPWQAILKAIDAYKLHIRMLADKDQLIGLHYAPDWVRDWKLDLPKMVKALRKAGLDLVVTSAGLYGDQKGDTGLKSAKIELGLLDKIYQAGGEVKYLSLDGPISRVIKGGRHPGHGGAVGTPGYSLEESVRHLVTYIKTVHEKYPRIEIGLIANFDWWDFQGHKSHFGPQSHSAMSGYEYNEVVDAILEALETAGDRIGFIHSDACYDYFVLKKSTYTSKPVNDALKRLALERYCREKGLEFGIEFNSEARGTQSEREFYEQTLQVLQLYRAVGGFPDRFIVESWFHFTPTLLPETKPYSFTYLTLDFAKQVNDFYPVLRKKNGARISKPP